MKPAGIQTKVAGVHNILDDLTEGQRHDGQIVTGQAQNGDADKEAEQTGHHTADHEGQQHCQRLRCGFVQHHIDQRAGEGTHAHEARMAETQLTKDADSQVQRDRQNDIGTDGHQLAGEGVGQQPHPAQNLDKDIKSDHDAQRDEIALGGLLHIFQHSCHLKPSH